MIGAALLLLAGWLALNEVLPLALLEGTTRWPSCPGRHRLPPRTSVRVGRLPPGDGGFTVAFGPWRWVVVNATVPLHWVPMVLAHEAAHIRCGHLRRLWLLYVIGLDWTPWAKRCVARWELEADEEVDKAFGVQGTGMGLRWMLAKNETREGAPT